MENLTVKYYMGYDSASPNNYEMLNGPTIIRCDISLTKVRKEDIKAIIKHLEIIEGKL